ncbi:ZBED1-like protein [Mya arenaria]|uniref:ZBED1-like protein n=1 Tax=Mya arenaria TaxID=6604 RepID=A0ABY7GD68_MYAAR|nr:ZBED1-like protein [Mya arenaria]
MRKVSVDDMDPAGSDDEVPIESPENPLIPHTQNTSSELNQDENSDTSTFRNGKRSVDRENAVCRLCRKMVKNCRGTQNMWFHFERHHKAEHAKISKPNVPQNPEISTKPIVKNEPDNMPTKSQKTVPEMYAKKHYPQKSERSTEITQAVAKFIAGDLQPLSVVGKAYFKNLLSVMDPKYELPSRRYFTMNVIPEMYTSVRTNVELELKECESLAITTDGWTSRACQSYLTVTAHGLDSNWKQHNYVLATRMLNVSHTRVNVGEALAGVVAEFGLQRPSGTAVVTDNAANMDIAAKAAMLTPHVKCFAHTVNLACQKGVKVQEFQPLLTKVRRIVSFFHKSTTATALLKLNQKNKELKLIQDVSTRWNSTYDMLQRYVDEHEAITATLSSSELRKNAKGIVTLSPDEITDLEAVMCVLGPLKTITTIMCDARHPTISLVLVFKNKITSAMVISENDSDLIKAMKGAIRQDMTKRYTQVEVEEFMWMCTALDPRFRSLPDLSNAATPSTSTATALPALPGMTDENANKVDLAIEVTTEPDQKRQKTGMEALLGDVYITHIEPGISTVECLYREVEKYRSEIASPLDTDPQVWWRSHENDYPNLSRLAKHTLHIPATSVASERVFSVAGDVVTATRSRLAPDMVDVLVFLKHKFISMDSGLGSPPGNPLDPQAQKTPKELNQDDSLDMSTFGHSHVLMTTDFTKLKSKVSFWNVLDKRLMKGSVSIISISMNSGLNSPQGFILHPGHLNQEPVTIGQLTALHRSTGMDRIKASCDQLRILLPYIKGRKLDMASILEMSVEYLSMVNMFMPKALQDEVDPRLYRVKCVKLASERYLRSSTTGFGESFTADQNLDRFTMNKPTYNSEETVHPVYSSHTTVNQYYPKYISASDSPKNTEPELGQKPTPDINNNVL